MALETTPVIQAGTAYTPEDIDHAAEDARKIIAESKILQVSMALMILSRQLYVLGRKILDDEIHHGWELANVGLVIQTLVVSAQERGMEPVTVHSLQQSLIQTVIPALDILIRAERDCAEQQAKQKAEHDAVDQPVLPGSDDQGPN